MKFVKIIAVALMLALTVTALVACGGKIDGKWELSEDDYTLIYEFDDGDVEAYFEFGDGDSHTLFEGEYETKGNALIMTVNDGGRDEEIEYEFKISGDKLTLIVDDEETVLKRVK